MSRESKVLAQKILWLTFALNLALWAGISSQRGFARKPAEVDGYCMYAYLPSLIIDGDVDFTNEYARIGLAIDARLWTPNRIATSGLPDNIYGVGYALVTAPAFLVAHGLTLAIASPALPADGYSLLYRVLVTLSALATTWLGLLLTYRIGCRYLPPVSVALGVASLWAGTNLTYYTTDNLSMSEGVSLGLFAVVCWLSLRIHDRDEPWHTWPLMGLAGGLLSVTHYLNGILLLVPAIVVSGRLLRALQARDRADAERMVLGSTLFLAMAALAWIPQLLVWKNLYGEWLVNTYAGKGSEAVRFHWLNPALWSLLTAPLNGYLYWSPLAALGFVGLARLVRRRPDLPLIAITVTTLVTVYCLASWWNWWFGNAFGNRGFIRLGLPIALGMAATIDWLSQRHRPLLLTLTGLGIGWNLWLMTLHITGMIKPQAPVVMRGMLRGTRELLQQLW